MQTTPYNATQANTEVSGFSTVTLGGAATSPGTNVNGEKNDANKKEIKRLRSTNPLYDTYKPLWDFYLAAYEGGTSFANEANLFKHPREHPDDFRDRTKRIFYHNFCFPLIDFFTTFIFTETIERDGGAAKDWYNEFLTNVNRKGNDITSFMMDVSDDMQIFGMSYVLVDMPLKPAIAGGVTVADEIALKLTPYWVLMKPQEVLDWVVDEFDKYSYIKRVQSTVEVDAQTMRGTSVEKYTEWTPTTIKISTVDVTDPNKPKLLGSTDLANELGCVPVECVRFKPSKVQKYFGESFLRDLAFISREVMNLTSLLQEFLYRQCFNLLAMEDDDTVEEAEQMQGDVGTANLLKYPKGAHVPSYVTPPVAPATFLQSEREANINSMYRIAAQDTVNELFNGGKASGFSKSQSFQRTVPKIATRADSLEDLESRLMKLTSQFGGKGDWKGTVKYKDHYEVTNLADSLSQMSTMFKDLQVQSKTFAQTQLKRMVSEFDGKLTKEDLIKVHQEIDATDWDAWFDSQKLAFIGHAASSPESALAFGQAPPAPAGEPPVPGKDSPTARTTAQRPSASSTTIASASSKSAVKK